MRARRHQAPAAAREAAARRRYRRRRAGARLPAGGGQVSPRRLARRADRQPGAGGRRDGAGHDRRGLPLLQREHRPAVRAHLRPEGEPAERVPAGRGASTCASAARAWARSSKIEPMRRAGRHHLRPDHAEARQGDRAAARRLDRARAAALGARAEVPGGHARQAARPASPRAPRSRSARRAPRSWRSTTSSTCSTTRRAWARATRSTAIGTGFAGRGRDLNTAIDELRPLLDDLEPVAANLRSAQTQLGRFFKALADTATEVAPVAEEQAVAVREPGHHLHRARRRSPGPSSRSRSPRARRARRSRSASSRASGRSCATTRPSSASCGPAWPRCPHSAPILADAFEAGTEILPQTPPMNADLADVFDTLADFSEDPLVQGGVDQLTRLSSSLQARRSRS